MREYIYFLNPFYNKDRFESNEEKKVKLYTDPYNEGTSEVLRGLRVLFGTGKRLILGLSDESLSRSK